MSILGRLLPREANNDYRGSRIALYTFWLLTVMPLPVRFPTPRPESSVRTFTDLFRMFIRKL